MENYRPVESGIFKLLPALKGSPSTLKWLITFDEDVNESALEEAIRRTVATFPLLGKKIAGRDGIYFYADNPLPFVISKGLKEVQPFLPEGNFHSMTFSYEKNKLCILVDHIFFDGAGMVTVLDTFFYHYFCSVDKKKYDVPSGVFVDNFDGLTAEPFPQKFETDDEPFFDNDSGEHDIFKFPELNPSLSQDELIKATELITVSADSGQFMRYVKSVGGTPLSALTTMFFTIFQKSHPANEKILKNITSVSLRSISESPDTILNAAYALSYFSTPENALKVDFDSERARNVELRKILKRYREPENMKKIANELIAVNYRIKSWLKNPSASEMPQIFSGGAVSFYIVYFGSFHLSEYAQRITCLQTFSNVNPVYSCMFFELGNKFFINLRQPFHSDLYKNILVEELHKRGVTSARLEI